MIPVSNSFKSANANPARKPIHLLSIAGYARAFTTAKTGVAGQYAWISGIEGGGLKVDHLSGWAQRSSLTMKVQDHASLITADLAGTVLDGAVATLQSGFAGMAQSDFATLAVMKVDKVELTEGGTVYEIVLRDLGVELNNVVYDSADDGWPTSSNHRRSVQGTPTAILTDVLENQIGYSAGQLNAAAFTNYSSNLFPGLTLVFSLDTAPQAQEFLNTEIFKALYGYGFWNYAGKFTPYFFAGQAAPNPAIALTTDNIIAPLPVETAGDYYNFLTYRLDYDGSNFNSEVDSVFAPGVTTYGLPAQQIIQAKGLRSPLGGALYTRLVAWTMFQRYGVRPGMLELDADWTAIVCEPGDQVTVTHPRIKNKLTGVVGMNGELFEVMGAEPDFGNMRVKLTLLDVNYLNNGPYKIAPDGTATWTGTPAQKADKYLYIAANATGKYADGTAGRAIYP
jgi:hypothetical protein